MVTTATCQLVADRLEIGLRAAFRHRYYVTDRAHFRVTWTDDGDAVRFTFHVVAPNVHLPPSPAPSVAREAIHLRRADLARLAHGVTTLDPAVASELHALVAEVTDAIAQKLLVRAFCSPTPDGAAEGLG